MVDSKLLTIYEIYKAIEKETKKDFAGGCSIEKSFFNGIPCLKSKPKSVYSNWCIYGKKSFASKGL